MNRAVAIRRVLIYTLVLNVLVAIAKILYGYFTDSIAMVSDGFHSSFDGISNVIGLIGIWIASHPPDEKHPYGHKKYETLFTIIIALLIFATCFQILRKVYQAFFEDHRTIVTQTSFIVMLITIAVNIFVMIYESRKGRQLQSEFLIADAMHTKSDIFASVAVIASLFLAKMGYHLADTVVGFVITLLIARIGYEILKRASDILVDAVCINTSVIEGVVKGIEGVKGCHDIRTRGTEHSIFLDLHILVDPKMPIKNAHEIAGHVEAKIKEEFPSVVDIVVHIEPEGS